MSFLASSGHLPALAALLASGALMAYALWPGLALGQVAGSAGSSIIITRTPYLSFESIPDSFAFPSATASGAAQHVFNSPDGPLETGKFLAVRDTRSSGGFMVQAQANDFTGGGTIASSSLRIVSTSSLSSPPEGSIVSNVYYLTGYDGIPDPGSTQTVTTPVNAASTNFASAATFDEVQSRPQNNALNAPVDILSGCLPATMGRNGIMGVGLAFDLYVPAYPLPGNYNSTITYTIMDYTADPCP